MAPPVEQTPPWVRVRAVVACDSLGEAPSWQDLRRRFTSLLSYDTVSRLLRQLTVIPDGAAWRQRATQRRSWLEADLTAGDETTVPAATTNLFLPESGNQAGLLPRCAQITFHIDFGPQTAQRPPYWRQRFQEAVALPDALLEWLETEVGLITRCLAEKASAQAAAVLRNGRLVIPKALSGRLRRALSELRKVALGTCGRDFGTPCAHENACVRCPLLRVDAAQMPRLEEIHANLGDRLLEAKEQGWLGEVAAIEATLAAAAQKLQAMRDLTTRSASTSIHIGMPDVRPSAGRHSPGL